MTEDGRRGLCPWTAKRGDIVVVLHGGKVPYLLRQDGPVGGVYRFVGECYVEAIMSGELAADATREAGLFEVA